MIAYALEMDVSLLPYAAELLADFDELGSDAELIVDVIRGLDLPVGARVVDLGSGKGAVALEIARETGFETVGVELFEPFVISSRTLTEAAGVIGHCRFVHGDVLNMAEQVGEFDVAVCAALGDVLGPLETTIDAVRRYVRPGGYMVISDAFVSESGSTQFDGFENYARLEETRRRLTTHGDELIHEVIEEADDEEDSREADSIGNRASALARSNPLNAQALFAFAKAQEDQYAYMEDNLIGAIWVLKRC